MSERTIANLIIDLREEQNISRGTLCEGLCDIRTLAKLELGEGIPDILLVDRLLQRLGKSPDMFEVVLSDEEYDGIVERDEIEDILDSNDIELARQKLEVYYEKYMEPDSIQQQYYCEIQAVIASCEEKHKTSVDYLIRAINCTVPNFSIKEKREVLLCVKEIELLIMLADEYYILNETAKAEELIEYLLEYIESNYTDKGELVKIYPKAVYLYVSKNLTKDRCVENIEKCEKAFEYMIEEGTTIYLAEIMDLLIVLYRELSIDKKARQLECQLGALKEVYEEEGFELYASATNMSWFKESLRRDYYLCSELVRGQRMALGLSQEELAEGIYENPESLARVESGKNMPTQRTFDMLMKKLGLYLGRYNGYLATDDYKVLELRKKINLLINRRDYESAKIAIEKLRRMLAVDNLVNNQYLDAKDIYLDYKLKVINEEEFYERSLKVLKITYKIGSNKLYRVPVRQEAVLINQLAISLLVQGKVSEGLELLKKFEDCYENGKVKLRHQFRRRCVLLRNYTKALEENDESDLAIQICKKGLELELVSGKGDTIDIYISEKMAIKEKKLRKEDEKKKAMKKYLSQAFYLSDLFKNNDHNKTCVLYYQNCLKENPEWY